MIWAGVKEIGCYQQPDGGYGLKACRYKGDDVKDGTTPNMSGYYMKNVPDRKNDVDDCAERTLKCFSDESILPPDPFSKERKAGEVFIDQLTSKIFSSVVLMLMFIFI